MLLLVLAAVSLAGFLKVLLFIAVLGVLIVLHEYGHFVLARLNGVRVLEFSVGFGPLIASVKSKKTGTQYSLRAVPLGGYCAMHGEDNKVSQAEQQREFIETVTINGREYDHDNFQAKSTWRRLAIIVAGPIANFILSFAILFAGALVFGVPGDSVQTRVGPLSPNMPAERAGIRPGDLIVSVNGVPVRSGEQLVNVIHRSLGKPLVVAFKHDDTLRQARITPAPCPSPLKPTDGCIGFAPIPAYQKATFSQALSDSGYQFVFIAKQTVGGLALLARHPVQYGGQISGVVGMAQAAGAFQDFGWGQYFFFAALISFALGVFNLLPLPALDGGRAAFIIGEMLRGKPIDPEKEAWVHITGFAVLLVLMVVINVNDVIKIVEGKGPF